MAGNILVQDGGFVKSNGSNLLNVGSTSAHVQIGGDGSESKVIAASNNLSLETWRSIDDIVFKTGTDPTNNDGVKTTQMFIDASENRVGIGKTFNGSTNPPAHKLHIVADAPFSSGTEIVTRSYINYTGGTALGEGTAIQGHAKIDSWDNTANMIGVHGLGEDVASGNNSRTMTFTGVKGEALGTTNGTTTGYGGYFTATGAVNNFSLFTEAGKIRFTDLATGSGNADEIVVADQDGTLSTSTLSSLSEVSLIP